MDSDKESLGKEIDRYLEEIGAFRLLNREEELALGERILSGDLDARNELVASNLRFGFFISKRYFRMAFADPLGTISAGNMGLINAADRFDPERGNKFITHATSWVIQSIQKYFAEMRYSMRVPVGEASLRINTPKATAYLMNVFGRNPTDDEVLAYLIGTRKFAGSPKNIKRVLGWDGIPELSLDHEGTWLDGGGASLLDQMVGSSGTETLRALEGQSLTTILDGVLDRLDETERFVLVAYGAKIANFGELSKVLGVSRETPRNIYYRARSKARRIAEKDPAFRELGMDYLFEGQNQ